MTNINTIVPATVQAKLKVPCSCRYCKEIHYQTINFKLQIVKIDDYFEGFKSSADYPHKYWEVRYVPDTSLYPLTEKPMRGKNKDLAQAIIEAKNELETFIKNNQ